MPPNEDRALHVSWPWRHSEGQVSPSLHLAASADFGWRKAARPAWFPRSPLGIRAHIIVYYFIYYTILYCTIIYYSIRYYIIIQCNNHIYNYIQSSWRLRSHLGDALIYMAKEDCGKAELWWSPFLRCSKSIFLQILVNFRWNYGQIPMKFRWDSGKAC